MRLVAELQEEFPAPAGINRKHGVNAKFVARVPRASGDKPRIMGWLVLRLPSSPRQRG
ncbi:hypothetical protein IHC78_001160 [Salmonella enterica subsp. houtenae]|nr:hypothetical protein [Salmonella enterica subsp. houtenae]